MVRLLGVQAVLGPKAARLTDLIRLVLPEDYRIEDKWKDDLWEWRWKIRDASGATVGRLYVGGTALDRDPETVASDLKTLGWPDTMQDTWAWPLKKDGTLNPVAKPRSS